MPYDTDLPRLDVFVVRGHDHSRASYICDNLCSGLNEYSEHDECVYQPGQQMQYGETFQYLLTRIERWLAANQQELNERYNELSPRSEDWRSQFHLVVNTSVALPVAVEEIRNLCKRFVPESQLRMVDVTVKGDPVGFDLSPRRLSEYEEYNREQLYV